MKIVFIGKRQRDFTTRGPVSGYPYYVSPGVPFVASDEDAIALTEQEPDRWQLVSESKPSKSKGTA